VRLLTPAVSLGANDTLIEHPAGLTHRVVDPRALASSGVTPGLLRVSVGIEDVDDLWADLDQAIELATGLGVAAAGRSWWARPDEAVERTSTRPTPAGASASGSRR